MPTAPGPFTRLRRRHGLVHSGLRRGTDRIEAVTSLVALLLALLVVPVAFTIGSEMHQRGLAAAATAAAERTRVDATLVADAAVQYPRGFERGVPPSATAQATWRAPDGQQRDGRLQVAAHQRAGERVAIWVDRDGDRVIAPRTPLDVAVSAVAVGVQVAILGWLLIGVAWWLACRMLARANYSRLDAEWARIGPGWNHRSWQ